MKLKKNIKSINKDLGEMPKYLYHGRLAKKEEENYSVNNIKIFENDNNLNYNIGRTHLDFAFHGYYLTPNKKTAMKWAFGQPKLRETDLFQIITFEINKKSFKKLRGRNLIVPDEDWAKIIYNNRAKVYKENKYDYIYGHMADGFMRDIDSKLKTGYYNEKGFRAFHKDILRDNLKQFLNDFYGKRNYHMNEIIKRCRLENYKNYQLCISSIKAKEKLKIVEIQNYKEVDKELLEKAKDINNRF